MGMEMRLTIETGGWSVNEPGLDPELGRVMLDLPLSLPFNRTQSDSASSP